MEKQSRSLILPTEKICNHTGASCNGKNCIGEKCGQFSYVDYGGYGHKKIEGGCVDYHLPKAIRRGDL